MFSNCNMMDKCNNEGTYQCQRCTRNLLIGDRYKPKEFDINNLFEKMKKHKKVGE